MNNFIKTEIETPETPEKKQIPYFRLFKLLIWILIITILITYFNYQGFKDKILTNEDIIVTINEGDTFRNISNKIEWVNNFWLKFYLSKNIPDFELQVWNYNIKKDSNIENIINSLRKPVILEKEITILEGWNIYDIDEHLSKKELINEGAYIWYVTSKEKIEKLTEFFPFLKWLNTLEWFLYPDTYKVWADSFWVNILVIAQLENFEKKVYNKILQNLSNKEVLDLVNLASIVEKEEKSEKNKSTVAGILKKRLNQWWMIWADITVCYPHELTSEECKMVVTKYINEKSEYNTRTMLWLPKTPIWNPNYSTIEATLNHKNTPYWFYLHDTSWWIHYAETNAKHELNKYNYLYK